VSRAPRTVKYQARPPRLTRAEIVDRAIENLRAALLSDSTETEVEEAPAGRPTYDAVETELDKLASGESLIDEPMTEASIALARRAIACLKALGVHAPKLLPICNDHMVLTWETDAGRFLIGCSASGHQSKSVLVNAFPPAGDPPEYLEYAIWQALTDLEEGATNTDRSRVAIRAITYAGYDIVPRAPKTEA
jgi:hypothetical protein